MTELERSSPGRRPGATLRPRRRSERGFTLIELMVALLVSSLLVGMILSIFSRMSMSYRGQQQIAGVQQVLAAARATVELDAKQAGLEIAQGFRIANDNLLHAAVTVTDSSSGPDQVGFFYADPTAQAVVTVAPLAGWTALAVDQTANFTTDTLVVLVNVNPSGLSGVGTNDPSIATFDACVLRVTAVTTNSLSFTTAAPWGKSPLSSFCPTPAVGSMIYNFVARAYRIDTTTPARSLLGALQQSATGGLLGGATSDWTDLAYGFTDIQVATRFYETGTVTDYDGDGDANRNWYSGGAQSTKTAGVGIGGTVPSPIQMTISLVAKTDRDIEGISTSATPNLLGTGAADYNTLGNRASIALPASAPWLADPLLQGSRIYRYLTFGVDFRNLGVGR